jgi:hypothetical protein
MPNLSASTKWPLPRPGRRARGVPGGYSVALTPKEVASLRALLESPVRFNDPALSRIARKLATGTHVRVYVSTVPLT